MTESRYIILGDIHGCIDEFNELIDLLDIKSYDTVISAGDLLDKGPDSAAVVRRAREVVDILVEGNHENKHARFRKHIANNTGTHLKMKNYQELQEITDGLTEQDTAWLDTAVLYHKISFDDKDIIVCHAGIPPCFDVLPGVEEISASSSKRRKFFSQLLRVRYVDERGRMIMLGEEKSDDPYWAEVYDGRFGHVYFGHQPFMQEEPKQYNHATGLDLGCVFGGQLCAGVFSNDGNDFKYVTVQAKAKYAEPMF